MPYAPGVQDISGQLRAQGIAQAGQAWSQAIGNISKTVGDAFQTYKQNQFITNQAMGQIAGYTQANPDVLRYLEGASSEDPNAPTLSPEVLKSYANVKSGKPSMQDAATVKAFIDAYDKNKSDQLQRQLMSSQALKIRAEALQAMAPQQKGNIMRFADVAQQYPVDKFDINAVPVAGQPGLVDVKSISPRAPASERVVATTLGNEVIITDPAGNEIRRIQGRPAIPQGYEATAEGGMRAVAGGPVAKEEAEKAEKQRLSSVMAENMSIDLNNAINQAVERVNIKTAGPGAGLQLLPGSEARNLASDLDQIKAIIGFDQLAKMRAASPTGGALGQVAVRELDFLQSVRGKLDQYKDPQELRRTLLRVQESMNRLNMAIQGRNPDEQKKGAGEAPAAAAPKTMQVGRFKVIAQ